MVRKKLITKMEKAQTRKYVNKLVHIETFKILFNKRCHKQNSKIRHRWGIYNVYH